MRSRAVLSGAALFRWAKSVLAKRHLACDVIPSAKEVRMPARAAETVPMLDLNTTPLIDVMLVLLVMLIITIPPQSHAVKLDLPVGIAVPAPDPVKNMLVITEAGALAWNGERVSKLQLQALLA